MNPEECVDLPPRLLHQVEAFEDGELLEFAAEHFDSDSHRLVKGD